MSDVANAEERRKLRALAGPEERGEGLDVEAFHRAMEPILDDMDTNPSLAGYTGRIRAAWRNAWPRYAATSAPDTGAEERLRAALPQGWSFWELTEYSPDLGQPRTVFARVRTANTIDRYGMVPEVSATGPTLAAAVDALVLALSGVSVDEEARP